MCKCIHQLHPKNSNLSQFQMFISNVNLVDSSIRCIEQEKYKEGLEHSKVYFCYEMQFSVGLMHKYLQLIYSKISIILLFKGTYLPYFFVAPPHFNVIAHFLSHCNIEPWTTAITAGALNWTPLWVPQGVTQMPLSRCSTSVPARFTMVILSYKSQSRSSALELTTGTLVGIASILGYSCCKGPDML